MKKNIKIEQQEKIAEFVGWTKLGNKWETPFDDAGMTNGESTHYAWSSDLRFNTEWNWLMLVVESIWDKIHNDRDYRDRFLSQDNNGIDVYDDRLLIEPVLEKVYNSALEFIEWYNEITKPDDQYKLQQELWKAGYNVVTCGNCPGTFIHKTPKDTLVCPHCGFADDSSSFPDLFYEGWEKDLKVKR